MGPGLRGIIEEHWKLLEAAPASTEQTLRVSDLPVDTPSGPVAAAVDSLGNRHVLIPVESHQKVRRNMDGPVLRLIKRPLESKTSYQLYADLACLQRDFNGVFTTLCADVLIAVEGSSGSPLKGMNSVLDHWKALFKTSGSLLGPHQMAGLFAELLILQRMLELSSSAHLLWKGPTRYRHDFSGATTALEVKASLSTEGRRIRVHGLDQLDAPRDGSLGLVWFRLEPTDVGGLALQDLVDRIMVFSDDESGLSSLLVEAGYRAADVDQYREVRFNISEERWYRVDSAFPKLTFGMLSAAGVPMNVQDVEYIVDLSSEPPLPLTDDEAVRYLRSMIEESV
ncbi:PD-(D/E)XK motif protein [Nocardia sp. NPDC058058]|uniref:PD-(D/E)XK motif protein n=1 Tax=Nocardia sp. NPDC058058 TaxID=3346317 RepID=UPI0036DF0644